jgi:hypothetical protein
MGDPMTDRMNVALRVLTSIQRNVVPSRADVENLRRWVGPSDRSADPIELACIVVLTEHRCGKANAASHTGAAPWDSEATSRQRYRLAATKSVKISATEILNQH